MANIPQERKLGSLVSCPPGRLRNAGSNRGPKSLSGKVPNAYVAGLVLAFESGYNLVQLKSDLDRYYVLLRLRNPLTALRVLARGLSWEPVWVIRICEPSNPG